jgi:hypothetical protein
MKYIHGPVTQGSGSYAMVSHEISSVVSHPN